MTERMGSNASTSPVAKPRYFHYTVLYTHMCEQTEVLPSTTVLLKLFQMAILVTYCSMWPRLYSQYCMLHNDVQTEIGQPANNHLLFTPPPPLMLFFPTLYPCTRSTFTKMHFSIKMRHCTENLTSKRCVNGKTSVYSTCKF